MKLIYIGRHFYHESGSVMSSLYHETGERTDWGKVEVALEGGEAVSIRPATQAESDRYEATLSRWKRKEAAK